MNALDTLAHAHWITGQQHDAGLTFAVLCRRNDPIAREIAADLMKIDALDLMHRVCRDDELAVAFDRMMTLRQALDLTALRLIQIEGSRRPPARRAAGSNLRP